MSFTHELLPDVHLEQINDPGGRYYLKDDMRYTSCTTLVGKMLAAFQPKNNAIEQWKKNVGEKKANEIRDRAAVKGTALHTICENYIKNDPNYRKKVPPLTIQSFIALKPYIDKYIDTVYGIEHRAYSNRFACAGTVDLICRYDGKPTILDFKTARKLKQKSQIIQYFLQTTLYRNMVEETHDFPIDQIVILIAVENEKQPQVFKFKADTYQETLEKIYAKYQYL